jgi:hypothetical protein
MIRFRRSTAALFAACIAIAAACLCAAATNDAPPAEVLAGVPVVPPDQAATILTPLFAALAGKYGALLQIVSVIASLRAVMKPVMGVVGAWHGDPIGAADDATRAHPAYRTINWLLDFCASIKLHLIVPPSAAGAASRTAGVLIAFIALGFGVTGCGITRADLGREVVATNGVVTRQHLVIREFVLWPAQQKIDKVGAGVGTVLAIKQQGLDQEGTGGTNGIAAIQAAAQGIMAGVTAAVTAAK